MTLESLLEGHVRLFDWLGRVRRECVYDSLRSVVARRELDVIHWDARSCTYAPLRLSCHRLHAGGAQGKGSVKGAVRQLKTGFWRARRIASLEALDGNIATGATRSAIAA